MQDEHPRSRFDAELHQRIDEVAHYLWDPIGINPHPQARDEYTSYVPELCHSVRANDKDALVEYMRWIVTERMGLQFDRGKAELAAEAMLSWGVYLKTIEVRELQR